MTSSKMIVPPVWARLQQIAAASCKREHYTPKGEAHCCSLEVREGYLYLGRDIYTCLKAVRTSSSFMHLRMPLPPPPHEAFSMTG